MHVLLNIDCRKNLAFEAKTLLYLKKETHTQDTLQLRVCMYIKIHNTSKFCIYHLLPLSKNHQSTSLLPPPMEFFKSVFSEPTPDPTPPTTPPSPIPSPTSSWGFGSTILKSITSKSESLIDNYYKDLQEFSSGLKKETSVIREAATRAVHDLPARLESGAAIAQESLEAVGQAIDTVGSTVSEIIGKDLNFAPSDGYLSGGSGRLDQGDDSNAVGSSAGREAELNFGANAKPYSRIDAMVRAVQCDIRTYIDEVEESGFGDWKLGFVLEEKREEIEGLLDDNSAVAEIYGEIVPNKVDEEMFWCRYFYRVDKVVRAEEARLKMVKRAISGEEEEELSWDFDDDDDDDNDHEDGEHRVKGELKEEEEERGKGVEDSEEKEGGGVASRAKGEAMVDDESLGEKSSVSNEKEGSDGKLGSDISIISSQRSSHAEDDLGWDEIEEIKSGDESNVGDQGSTTPSSGVDVGKKLSGKEDEEELTWDIEDDEEEPLKL